MMVDIDRSQLLNAAQRVHFVGIGGIGMSALAQLLAGRGKAVTGSDARSSSMVDRLRAMGIKVDVGHRAEAVAGADLVVATSAARPDNPELVEALRLGIPLIKRAELLGWLMSDSYGIAIAGTHGKTTTTAMVAFLLLRGGMDPTALVGGEPLDFENHGLVGGSRYLVAEADEFDRSFLRLWPRVAVVTSIEVDHLDCYEDLEDIAETFAEFASRVPTDGMLLTSADDGVLASMKLDVPRQSYGFAEDASWRILECHPVSPFGTGFSFAAPDGQIHSCRLLLSGRHYAMDALAAIAAANHVGLEPSAAVKILEEFHGTRRRYEVVGKARGVLVMDDYAHHPTAAAETLRAARERHAGRIWCVFQPHTVNRTKALLSEFAAAFQDADRLVLLPIYQPAGREEAEASETIADLVGRIERPVVDQVKDIAEAVEMLSTRVASGDMVLTMGAGDVYRVGQLLLERLRR